MQMLLTCLIILHNWFAIEYRNFVVAIWASLVCLIPIIQKVFFDSTTDLSGNYVRSCLIIELNFMQFIISMIMCGSYLALSILCLFYFYHHPHHIGVVVSTENHTTADNGFFMDTLTTNVMLTSTQMNKSKRTATLYEIFKFRE